ncbi:adenosine deaminase [Alteromonas sp. ASW11-19]|uniref:adenosine deaminase n=1 Tax=Alteromonas salexigens TaxID=2982530 RepID=A0ABT2VMF4_9ALTE|nr:adenosine deaminase [Alteromonas salexigens]MCU7554048.1 adenosine deaminase [Alteromonas salexigens]
MLNPALPAGELHRHLDGNIRPATIWALARKHGIALDATSEQDLFNKVLIKDRTSDLMAFIAKLEYGVSVLADPEACYQIALENVADAASEQLDFIELRFSPYFMSRAFNLPLDAVVEAVCAGVEAGRKQYGVEVALLGILSRTFGVPACETELNSLLTQADALLGLDLAGDEARYPAPLFKQLFTRARDAGWQVTVHAGEAAGPESVWQAIHELGASRIGHGVAAVDDPALMTYLAEHQIGIESCPTSNFQTGSMTDTVNHPLKTFLDYGIAVTLNTDDPGISDITLADEYRVASEVIGLSQAQLDTVQRNTLKQSFLPESTKKRLLNQYGNPSDQ